MLAIINDAARAYHGVIPADRWHEPYMPADELKTEIIGGSWCSGSRSRTEVLSGVIGNQDKGEVALIRHAYVAPYTHEDRRGNKASAPRGGA